MAAVMRDALVPLEIGTTSISASLASSQVSSIPVLSGSSSSTVTVTITSTQPVFVASTVSLNRASSQSMSSSSTVALTTPSSSMVSSSTVSSSMVIQGTTSSSTNIQSIATSSSTSLSATPLSAASQSTTSNDLCAQFGICGPAFATSSSVELASLAASSFVTTTSLSLSNPLSEAIASASSELFCTSQGGCGSLVTTLSEIPSTTPVSPTPFLTSSSLVSPSASSSQAPSPPFVGSEPSVSSSTVSSFAVSSSSVSASWTSQSLVLSTIVSQFVVSTWVGTLDGSSAVTLEIVASPSTVSLATSTPVIGSTSSVVSEASPSTISSATATLSPLTIASVIPFPFPGLSSTSGTEAAGEALSSITSWLPGYGPRTTSSDAGLQTTTFPWSGYPSSTSASSPTTLSIALTSSGDALAQSTTTSSMGTINTSSGLLSQTVRTTTTIGPDAGSPTQSIYTCSSVNSGEFLGCGSMLGSPPAGATLPASSSPWQSFLPHHPGPHRPIPNFSDPAPAPFAPMSSSDLGSSDDDGLTALSSTTEITVLEQTGYMAVDGEGNEVEAGQNPDGSTSQTAPSSQPAISMDGSCGPRTNQTCTGSQYGPCCSSFGFCGDSEEHCQDDCTQADAFGTCDTNFDSNTQSLAKAAGEKQLSRLDPANDVAGTKENLLIPSAAFVSTFSAILKTAYAVWKNLPPEKQGDFKDAVKDVVSGFVSRFSGKSKKPKASSKGHSAPAHGSSAHSKRAAAKQSSDHSMVFSAWPEPFKRAPTTTVVDVVSTTLQIVTAPQTIVWVTTFVTDTAKVSETQASQAANSGGWIKASLVTASASLTEAEQSGATFGSYTFVDPVHNVTVITNMTVASPSLVDTSSNTDSLLTTSTVDVGILSSSSTSVSSVTDSSMLESSTSSLNAVAPTTIDSMPSVLDSSFTLPTPTTTSFVYSSTPSGTAGITSHLGASSTASRAVVAGTRLISVAAGLVTVACFGLALLL